MKVSEVTILEKLRVRKFYYGSLLIAAFFVPVANIFFKDFQNASRNDWTEKWGLNPRESDVYANYNNYTSLNNLLKIVFIQGTFINNYLENKARRPCVEAHIMADSDGVREKLVWDYLCMDGPTEFSNFEKVELNSYVKLFVGKLQQLVQNGKDKEIDGLIAARYLQFFYILITKEGLNSTTTSVLDQVIKNAAKLPQQYQGDMAQRVIDRIIFYRFLFMMNYARSFDVATKCSAQFLSELSELHTHFARSSYNKQQYKELDTAYSPTIAQLNQCK